MEATIETQIKNAIRPLLERIAALEADNLQSRKDITALQVTTTHHKMSARPGVAPLDRPITAKGTRRVTENHQVKPAPVRSGAKKEEVKPQQEEGKVESSKVVGGRLVNGKAIPSPNLNKDHYDPKNIKGKPATGVAARQGPSIPSTKGIPHDKKPVLSKPTEVEDKIEENTSKEKEPKSAPTAPGLKSPAPKGKATDKKSMTPSTAPAKKTLSGKIDPKGTVVKGGKSISKAEKKEEDIKEDEIDKTGGKEQAIPDHVQVQMKEQAQKEEPIPDQVKVESVALNSPYTPSEVPAKQTSSEEQKVEPESLIEEVEKTEQLMPETTAEPKQEQSKQQEEPLKQEETAKQHDQEETLLKEEEFGQSSAAEQQEGVEQVVRQQAGVVPSMKEGEEPVEAECF